MNKCYERSHSCCITSTDEPTEIAHIAPLHIGGEDMEERNRRNFWRVMRVFFYGERVDRWMAATARPVSQTNLMCVSDNVHGLYEKARFVLRPISQDSDGIKAEFYWLPYMEYEMRTLGECASSAVNQISSPFGCKPFECTTETKIVCGSVVEFKTANRLRYPLPSWDILDMQWAMHRVAAWSFLPAFFGSGWSRLGVRLPVILEEEEEEEEEEYNIH